jgi:hypothetical protein
MNMNNPTCVHFLLFRCKQCNNPVSIAIFYNVRNLEEIDGHTYEVKCACGSSKDILGVEAIRHWVVPWEDRKDVYPLTARTDEIGFTN